MKIHIEGYQSISEPVSIEVEGFTALTGESNLGKSAAIRAICGLLGNQSGNNFITVGRESSSVTVDNQGHTATWLKTHGSSEYNIDGEQFKKCGRGGPPEEIKDLGFFEVMARDKLYRPQVMRQFDTPFIISENSPRAAAELLATSKHQQVITKAIKSVQKDQNTLAGTIRVRESDLNGVEVLLSLVEPARELIVVSRDRVNQAVTNWNSWQDYRDSVVSIQARSRALTSNIDITEGPVSVQVPEVPPPGTYNALRGVQGRWRQTVALQDVTLPKSIPTVPPASDVDRPARMLVVKTKWYYDHLVGQVLGNMPEVPEVNHDLIEGWKQRKIQLIDLRQAFRETAKAFEEVDEKLAEADHELDGIQSEIARIIKELGYCPICDTGPDVEEPWDHQNDCRVVLPPSK